MRGYLAAVIVVLAFIAALPWAVFILKARAFPLMEQYVIWVECKVTPGCEPQ